MENDSKQCGIVVDAGGIGNHMRFRISEMEMQGEISIMGSQPK